MPSHSANNKRRKKNKWKYISFIWRGCGGKTGRTEAGLQLFLNLLYHRNRHFAPSSYYNIVYSWWILILTHISALSGLRKLNTPGFCFTGFLIMIDWKKINQIMVRMYLHIIHFFFSVALKLVLHVVWERDRESNVWRDMSACCT